MQGISLEVRPVVQEDPPDRFGSWHSTAPLTRARIEKTLMTRKKPTSPPLLPDNLSDYRQWLMAAEQKSQEDFDKTVLSLSGGALGVSFVFLKNVVGIPNIHSPLWLVGSWVSWGVSSICVLASFYTSHHSLRRAIKQVDDGTIRQQVPGGWTQIATAILNAAGAALFLGGVLLMTVFVYQNVGKATDEQLETTTTAHPAETAKSTGQAAGSANLQGPASARPRTP